MRLSRYLTKKTWPQLSPKKLKSLHWIIDCLKSFPKNYKSTSAKFPVKVSLKLKTEKYGLMKKKYCLRDEANKTLCSLDRQFKENFGAASSIKVKKVKIMENHVNKKVNKSAE